MKKKNKITIVGSGYVGMSLSVLLAQKNPVTVLDIDEERVNKINSKISTIADNDIDKFLSDKALDLKATLDSEIAYKDADYIVICTPTNYDPDINYFDTSSVDAVISNILHINNAAYIIIKSTIPIGHTESLIKKYKTKKIIFSPEFLREGRALEDNLNPSRIIMGSECEASHEFALLLKNASNQDDIPMLFMRSTEAEAVKLFANSYLAMRVSFFNELDSFAISKNLDTRNIVNGISYDKRIGSGYNNPSFGYGGYCLPKDTKQLLREFDSVPQNIIEAIVSSNKIRKDFISKIILDKKPTSIGFFRLIMKADSDNFRFSSIQGIIDNLQKTEVNIFIYEPLIEDKTFKGIKVIHNLDEFKSSADIIVTNRYEDCLDDVRDKVFTRDIFSTD